MLAMHHIAANTEHRQSESISQAGKAQQRQHNVSVSADLAGGDVTGGHPKHAELLLSIDLSVASCRPSTLVFSVGGTSKFGRPESAAQTSYVRMAIVAQLGASRRRCGMHVYFDKP